MQRKGLLVVISAPSGGGKTTIIQKVLSVGNGNYRYSISATTRKKRPNEEHGRDYYFLTTEEFWQKQRRGEFVEWAEVHGDWYATPREPLERWLEEGRIVFLDLDVDGGLRIKQQYGDTALLIFVRPPSFESLVKRLRDRNTESEAQIEKRLQRYPKEIEASKRYDCQIVNENLDDTVAEIIEIINQRVMSLNGGKQYDQNPAAG